MGLYHKLPLNFGWRLTMLDLSAKRVANVTDESIGQLRFYPVFGFL
jgi:hypothetical protein